MTYNDLIVIPTNNDKESLLRLLSQIHNDAQILVVDTGSVEPYLDEAKSLYPHILVDRTPFKGYSWGAFLWAYWHYVAQNYLLLQDSLEVNDPNFLLAFRDKCPPRGIAAWTHFLFGFDFDNERLWSESMFGVVSPKYGVFGPIFYTHKTTLDELTEKGLLFPYPVNKEGLMACERILSVVLEKAGMENIAVTDQWPLGKMKDSNYGLFKKTFVNRP